MLLNRWTRQHVSRDLGALAVPIFGATKVGECCHRPLRFPGASSRRINTLDNGGLAERLRSGLQIREDRFDSGTRLHYRPVKTALVPNLLAKALLHRHGTVCLLRHGCYFDPKGLEVRRDR